MFDLILAMRPLIAIGVSMAAALLILLLGDRVQPNLREGMTFGAAIIKGYICIGRYDYVSIFTCQLSSGSIIYGATEFAV